jgi:hypothetical protein
MCRGWIILGNGLFQLFLAFSNIERNPIFAIICAGFGITFTLLGIYFLKEK